MTRTLALVSLVLIGLPNSQPAVQDPPTNQPVVFNLEQIQPTLPKPPALRPLQPVRILGGDQHAKFEYYSRLVLSHSGKIEPGRPTVLALRGLAKNNRHHDSAENVGPYNDTFVLLSQDRCGHQSIKVFPGSTHAGQETSTRSPDGVAQLKPGNYEAVPFGDHNGLPSWHLLTRSGQDEVPAWRDVDGDGYISPAEKGKPGVTATSILIHNGAYADHGSSIGCQVLPPQEMVTFIKTVGEKRGFHYTLVDANV